MRQNEYPFWATGPCLATSLLTAQAEARGGGGRLGGGHAGRYGAGGLRRRAAATWAGGFGGRALTSGGFGARCSQPVDLGGGGAHRWRCGSYRRAWRHSHPEAVRSWRFISVAGVHAGVIGGHMDRFWAGNHFRRSWPSAFSDFHRFQIASIPTMAIMAITATICNLFASGHHFCPAVLAAKRLRSIASLGKACPLATKGIVVSPPWPGEAEKAD